MGNSNNLRVISLRPGQRVLVVAKKKHRHHRT